jgi:hypothetical protein
VLVLILAILAASPSSIEAVTVWSDNFNDGNYNDWTVTKGIFAVSSIEGASNSLLGNQGSYSVIHHDSNIAIGTWSFRLYNIADRTTEIYFMATEEPTSDVVDGYKLDVWSTSEGNPIFKIRKCVDGWDETLDQYISSDDSYTWISVYITRTADGQICLYTGSSATFRFQVQDSSFSSSEYFGFCAGFTVSIDDVVVSDTVDFEPPQTPTETTPTTQPPPTPAETTPTDTPTNTPINADLVMVLVVGLLLAAVVMVAVVLKKR